MADDWEDWEAEDYTPKLPAVAPAAAAGPSGEFETIGQAVLAKATAPDASKFAGEDEEEEEQPQYKKPSQPKKKVEKKYDRGEEVQDEPLDDPVAEKLRQQRLIEESDYHATRELFGGSSAGDGKRLDALLPKSVKDFEEYVALLATKYIAPHAASKHYKLMAKSIVRSLAEHLTAEETKDLETSIAGIRADKVKAEKAEAAAKAKGPRKTVNVGRGGGTAGLDDYIYDEALDDDFDFM